MTGSSGQRQALAATEAHIPRGDGEHILFVDDDDELRRVAEILIAKLGYRVTAFPGPADALAAFAARPHSFDAVVTDFSMPDMQGDTLIHRLRAIRSDLPALILSGVASAIESRVIERLQPVRLVSKPVSRSRLAAALSATLQE